MDKNKTIQNAQKYVQKGQLDKAIREYEKVVEADPRDVRTRLKIGDLYAKKGSIRDAADTYLQVAEAYSQQGFFLKAVAVYKQILKLDPNLVDVNIRLAELYHQLGLMSDAMAQYQSVANYYEKEGDTRSSFQTLQKMLDLDPDNIASRIKLAEMYSKEAMVAEAVDQFRQAAAYLKENNRIEDYIKVAERLIYHDPSDVELTRELANIYLAKADTKRALAKLQVCFKANPRDVETLHLLSRAFLDLGQPTKTVSVYKELAKIYGDDGDLDQQRATWKKVLELAPDDPDAQAALGSRPAASAEPRPGAPVAGPPPGATAAAVAPGAVQPPGARTAVMPAPAIAAAAAPGRDGGGGGGGGAEAVAKLLTETDVYVKYGLHDKAIEHLKKVFALDPQNLDGHEKAKDLFKQAGNQDAAAQELVTLIQLTQNGEPERARGYLSELLSVNPSLPEVQGFIAALGQPEAEQVSFLDPAAAAGDVVIADDDDDVLVADGADFDAEDDFGLEIEATEPEILEASPELEIDPGFTVDAGDDAIILDDGSDDDAIVLDDGSDDDAIVLDDGSGDDAIVLDDGSGDDILLDDDVDDATLVVGGDDDTALVLDEPDEIIVGGEEDGARGDNAFVIDADLLDADLDSAVAAAEAAVAADDSATQSISLDAVPDLNVLAEDAPRTELLPQISLEDAPVELEMDAVDPVVEAVPEAPAEPAADGALAGGGRSAEEIADELEEAEFFIQQGLPDEAQEVLQGILAAVPEHPGAKALLAQLTADDEAPADDAISFDDSEVPGDEAETGFDDFDLAGELAEELASLEADDAPQSAPLDEFQISADDVFAEFKKGVAKQVGSEDAATHYDLGIAYREMGLVRDAIDEFKLAGAQASRRVQSLTLVGVCQRELGDVEEAIESFKGALDGAAADPNAAKALYYELGDTYQIHGDDDEARYFFRKAFKVDPKFRDVKDRLAALGDDGSGPDDPDRGSGTPAGSGGPGSSGGSQEKRAGKARKVGYV